MRKESGGDEETKITIEFLTVDLLNVGTPKMAKGMS
jgi:hypothetical protein